MTFISMGSPIANTQKLRMTFTLSSMVALDKCFMDALCTGKRIQNFDEMIPPEYRQALGNHHKYVAHVPLMAYAIPLEEDYPGR